MITAFGQCLCVGHPDFAQSVDLVWQPKCFQAELKTTTFINKFWKQLTCDFKKEKLYLAF